MTEHSLNIHYKIYLHIEKRNSSFRKLVKRPYCKFKMDLILEQQMPNVTYQDRRQYCAFLVYFQILLKFRLLF